MAEHEDLGIIIADHGSRRRVPVPISAGRLITLNRNKVIPTSPLVTI